MPSLIIRAAALYTLLVFGLWLGVNSAMAQECSNQADVDACEALCVAAEGVCGGVCGGAQSACEAGCSAASGACSGLCGAAIATCTAACTAADCTLDTLGCAIIDCCAGACTGSDACESCFDGCAEDCQDDCAGDCSGCQLSCKSGCATDCSGCRLPCEADCQSLCIPYKLAGESCIPLVEPCVDGLDCRLLPATFGDDAFICMPNEDDDLFDDNVCREFYSRDVHQTALDIDTALNFGVGGSATAVVGGSLEIGMVYGNDGCYGCYLTECVGASSNVGIDSYASVGLYTSYSDFQGESIVFAESAGEGLNFITTQVINRNDPPDLIGTASCFSVGASVLPFDIGVYDCVTTTDTVGCIMESGGPLVEVTNNPPTAVCAAQTTCASPHPTCTASVGIDGGSFDVDGDTLSFTQSPSSPYGIGSRSVTLTALDPYGGSDTCSANVTVNDCTQPTVTCPAGVTVECTGNSQATATLGAPSAVDCSSVSFSDTQLPSYPLGMTTVGYTGTDSYGNAASCSTSVTVVDTQPPSITCPADIGITSAPGQCSYTTSFAVTSGDICDPSPAISCVDQNGIAVSPAGHSYPVGTTSVTCTSTDDTGNKASCGFNVAINDPPIINVSPATQVVQYSDKIADVTLTGTDCASDTTLINDGFPAGTSLSSASCGDYSGGRSCRWTLSGAVTIAEASAVTHVKVNDGALDSTGKTVTIDVKAEDSVPTFDPANSMSVPVATDGGDSGPFSLVVHVQELSPDVAAPGKAMPGNIGLAVVSMALVPVGPGGTINGVCTPDTTDVTGSSYADILHVSCDFDAVPVNVYTVQVTVNGVGYYTGYNEDVLVIYDPSLGFTTGGFAFRWPDTGERTTGGYNMKYNKKQTKVQGNLLLIRHMPDGTKYRIKSNALYGLAIGDGGGFGWATFSGKGGYSEPGWDDGEGNHSFVMYVEDHGEPGTGKDMVWIEVKDKMGNILPSLSLDRPTNANLEVLKGGNIVVPHNPSK